MRKFAKYWKAIDVDEHRNKKDYWIFWFFSVRFIFCSHQSINDTLRIHVVIMNSKHDKKKTFSMAKKWPLMLFQYDECVHISQSIQLLNVQLLDHISAHTLENFIKAFDAARIAGFTLQIAIEIFLNDLWVNMAAHATRSAANKNYSIFNLFFFDICIEFHYFLLTADEPYGEKRIFWFFFCQIMNVNFSSIGSNNSLC